jgi:hypothetical protein
MDESARYWTVGDLWFVQWPVLNHAGEIAAIDFFTVPTAIRPGLQRWGKYTLGHRRIAALVGTRSNNDRMVMRVDGIREALEKAPMIIKSRGRRSVSSLYARGSPGTIAALYQRTFR